MHQFHAADGVGGGDVRQHAAKTFSQAASSPRLRFERRQFPRRRRPGVVLLRRPPRWRQRPGTPTPLPLPTPSRIEADQVVAAAEFAVLGGRPGEGGDSGRPGTTEVERTPATATAGAADGRSSAVGSTTTRPQAATAERDRCPVAPW